MNEAARAVLAQYPLATVRSLEPLGNRGGFSGARLWRVESDRGPLCLRAWPPEQQTPRLSAIHRWMRLAGSQDFVPAVHELRGGGTWCVHAERLWELTKWMPGQADFHENPSIERIESAGAALAILHRAWESAQTGREAIPAIERRLDHVHDWLARAAAGWEVPAAGGPVQPWAERAWRLVRPRLQMIERKLMPWLEARLPLQPCLCDIWHDHVLFQGNRVSGLIDYGAMKIDNVAVDLARMIGSLAGDNAELRNAGLTAYSRVRPLSLEEEALIPILDESTIVLGAANWLKWIYIDNKRFEDEQAVAQRLAHLVQRIR